MKWKLVHKQNHERIENEGGKTLSYNPNLGIQIIEKDGYAFKDLNNSGTLEPYEDWRLPLTQRVRDFSQRFALWQENECLFYRKGKIKMPKDIYDIMQIYHEQEDFTPALLYAEKEDISYLKDNYIVALLLMMMDNDQDTGNEDYLLQLIVQSIELGLFENIVYSIWKALKKYMGINCQCQSSKSTMKLNNI